MVAYEIERRPFSHTGLAFDLVNHLYIRLALGNAAIVTERPEELMGEMKRQILKLTHRLQNRRAKEQDISRLIETSHAISRIQCWRLSAAKDDFDTTVQLGTAADFLASPPASQILYVTEHLDVASLNMISSWMREGDLVVIYDQEKAV